MLKAYKIEINPTEDQIVKINKTIGTCRFIYNFFIAHNQENYLKGNKFIGAMVFSKWLNNTLIPNNPEYTWIKEVSSKSVKQAMFQAEIAFKRFFKKQSGFPKFKKKNKSNVKMYLPKNNKTDWKLERHRIKIPTLGFMRLKEFGYIPIDSKVMSGTVSYQAGKYFVSILCNIKDSIKEFHNIGEPIGIDLGIKEFAVTSTKQVFKNINKDSKIKKLIKRLKREQRRLSRKFKKGGKATVSAKNYKKQVLRVQKIHFKLSNIREGFVRSVVNSLVKAKPKYVSVEDLNVKGMMKNRCLSRAIQEQTFHYFRKFLIQQCNKQGIEVRVINRWFPSSKLCSCCGQIKNDLTLKDREYVCDCGLKIDRDLNAAINIRDCKTYKVA